MSFAPFRANTSEGWLYTHSNNARLPLLKTIQDFFFWELPSEPIAHFLMFLLVANLYFFSVDFFLKHPKVIQIQLGKWGK